MKPYLSTVLVLLFTAITASTQVTEKLRVTGTVVSLKAHVSSVKLEKTDKWPFERRINEYNADLTVNVQFTNLTDHPLIIFKPVVYGPSMETSFLRETTSTDEITGDTYSSTYGLFFSNKSKPADELQLLAAKSVWEKYLSEKTPSESRFEIIAPHSQYETSISILNVENGYKLEKHVGEKPIDNYCNVIPEYPALKIRFSLKPESSKDDAILLTARDNWRKFGELVLDSDGDYNVKTEMILNPSVVTY